MVHTVHSPPQEQERSQHQANIAKTLNHRTHTAHLQQDLQLLQLLQKEQQQLDDSISPQSLRPWQWVKTLIAKRTRVSIEKIQAASGAVAWRVHDPRTGRSRYAENSAEIVAWLEANHLC